MFVDYCSIAHDWGSVMRLHQLAVCLVVLSAAGIVAAQTETARPKVIFTPIVLSGDPAPGGGTFYRFLYPGVINDSDQIVFQAVTAGNASGGGLYMAQRGGISLIAPGTQDAPGYAAARAATRQLLARLDGNAARHDIATSRSRVGTATVK